MSDYTAENIHILDAAEIRARWFWAEAGELASRYRRPEVWIRRGLLACEAAGIPHDYFVDRYLRRRPIPRRPEVEEAFKELLP